MAKKKKKKKKRQHFKTKSSYLITFVTPNQPYIHLQFP